MMLVVAFLSLILEIRERVDFDFKAILRRIGSGSTWLDLAI